MSLLIALLKKQLNDGFSPILVIVGRRGVGKTVTAMRIAEDLFSGYDYNVHHTYSLSEYLKIVNIIDPHSVVAFEEAGRSLSRAQWQSPINRIFNEANQTQRYKNFATIIILPDLSYLANAHIKMVEFLCWVTQRGSFTFYRNFRVPIDTGSKMMRFLRCKTYPMTPLPSDKNMQKYLLRDAAEKNKIRSQLLEEALEIEGESLNEVVID
jgi:Cdc6-like AAA superfamily ATPase